MKACESWVAFNRIVVRLSTKRSELFGRLEILDRDSDQLLRVRSSHDIEFTKGGILDLNSYRHSEIEGIRCA
jgi:hypothetical protein